MIKNQVGIAVGVTSQACRAIVRIPTYAVVFVVGFRIGMAGDTSKFSVIRRVGMAIHTLIPFSFVLTAINWEILCVVVKRRRHPGIFSVAIRAIGRKLGGRVVGASRCVVVSRVAAKAGIRRIGIIAVVAGRTVVGYCRMRPI